MPRSGGRGSLMQIFDMDPCPRGFHLPKNSMPQISNSEKRHSRFLMLNVIFLAVNHLSPNVIQFLIENFTLFMPEGVSTVSPENGSNSNLNKSVP